MLLGKIDKAGLTKAPFKKWFTSNYNDYLVNEKVANKLEDSLKNYNIRFFWELGVEIANEKFLSFIHY